MTKPPKLDRARERRILDEVGVDAYGPEERAMGWYYYLEDKRERWIEEKGMQVLNFCSDQHKATSVDVFVTDPFDFDSEYDNAFKGDLAPGLPV